MFLYVGVAMEFLDSCRQKSSKAYQKTKFLLLFLMGCFMDETVYRTLQARCHDLRIECFLSVYYMHTPVNPDRNPVWHCRHFCPIYLIFSQANMHYSAALLLVYHILVPFLAVNFICLLVSTVFSVIFDIFYLGVFFSYFKFMLWSVCCIFLADGCTFSLRSIYELIQGRYIYRLWYVRIDVYAHCFIILMELAWVYNLFLFNLFFYLMGEIYSFVKVFYIVYSTLHKYLAIIFMLIRYAIRGASIWYSYNGKKRLLLKCGIWFASLSWAYILYRISFLSERSIQIFGKIE